MFYIPTWKAVLIVLVCLLGTVYALPNFFYKKTLDSFPSWFPKQQVSLGLDLQGGSHLLLEANLKVVVEEYLSSLLDATRQTLRKNRVGYTALHLDKNTYTFSFKLRDLLEENKKKILYKDLQAIDPDLSITFEEDTVLLSLKDAALKNREKAALEQSIEIVRRRIDETGTKEPTIQQQGDDRILIQLPGIDNPEHIKNLLGQTAKLSFRLLDPNMSTQNVVAGHIPVGSEILEGEGDEKDQKASYVVRKQVIVSGETLVDAQPDYREGRPIVTFKLDALGAKKFGDATKANIGKRFAIVLDKNVISAPVIQEPIYGGNVQITGHFTVQQASDLALLLRAGALPAPLTVLEERTVGPDLGADSILAGEHATIVSIIFIALFMLVAYSLVGVVADIAMVFNLVLLLAALSLLGATLTLPGIAGIALTLGMAVDANVLINERIKEELRQGKGIVSAIDAGYNRAMATIVDSNVTTLIGSILLYIFGTGPIRGFAVTLSVGILISMFTAVSLSRLILVSWIRWKHPKTLWI